jgi:hypothetical protein
MPLPTRGIHGDSHSVLVLMESDGEQKRLISERCRIENGDTKPRVRALEVERALQRVAVQQGLVLNLVLSSMFVNIGTVLSVSAMPLASSLSFAAAAIFGLLTLVKLFKVKGLEKKELQLSGAVPV